MGVKFGNEKVLLIESPSFPEKKIHHSKNSPNGYPDKEMTDL